LERKAWGGRVGIDVSGSGALGSAFGTASNADGSRQSAFADVFKDQLSPISNSNLLYVRENLNAAKALAATQLIRAVGGVDIKVRRVPKAVNYGCAAPHPSDLVSGSARTSNRPSTKFKSAISTGT